MLVGKKLVNGLAFGAGTTQEVSIDRGDLLQSLTIGYRGTVTLSGAGTAVKSKGTLFRRIELTDTNNDVLHSISGTDLVDENFIFGATPVAAQIGVPPGATATTHAVSAYVTLNFRSLWASQPELTNLPTWMYPRQLRLRITWGDPLDLWTGTPAASGYSITPIVQANFVADPRTLYPGMSDYAYGAGLGRMYRSAIDINPNNFGAGQTVRIALPDTRDIRGLIIKGLTLAQATDPAESCSTGNNALISRVGLWVNGTVPILSDTDFLALQAHNAQVFENAAAMPTGIVVFDAAEDKDVTAILEAPRYNSTELRLTLGGTVNTLDRIRVNVLGIGAFPVS